MKTFILLCSLIVGAMAVGPKPRATTKTVELKKKQVCTWVSMDSSKCLNWVDAR